MKLVLRQEMELMKYLKILVRIITNYFSHFPLRLQFPIVFIAEKVALQNFKRWSEKSNSISPIEESRAFNISDIPVSHKYKHKCC